MYLELRALLNPSRNASTDLLFFIRARVIQQVCASTLQDVTVAFGLKFRKKFLDKWVSLDT